jgi:hypothetical protein
VIRALRRSTDLVFQQTESTWTKGQPPEMRRGRETNTPTEVHRQAERRRARTPQPLTQTGKHRARQVLKARILLKADVSEAGGAWTDSQIAAARKINDCPD